MWIYKALVKNNINLDIIAGTSIGGINAAIIAGSKNNEHTDQLLEDFWLELSDGFVDMDNLSFFFLLEQVYGTNTTIFQILSIFILFFNLIHC
jgi:predicted acylesterase/phospholipase RssA